MKSLQPIITLTPLYLAREDAAKFLSISVSTLEKMAARGEAPKPRLISKGRTAWLTEELVAWGRTLPVSDALPVPNSGYGRAGKPESAGTRPSRKSESFRSQ